jgi:cytoskeleton protein RodZ
MSEEKDKPVDKVDGPDKKGPLAGELLAEARREQQISVLEVAKELHLDEHKVRALECNEFDVLGAPVFAKGHLRKYAQLVGVDADDVFAGYYRMTHMAGIPPVVVSKPRASHEISPGPWIAAIVVVIVAAASYFWFASGSTPTSEPAPAMEEPLVPEQAVEDSPVHQQTVVVATTLPEEAPVASEPVVEDSASASAQELAQQLSQRPALADGEVLLSLAFTGDCWTEISDATGRRLFFDMGRSGRTVDLSGQAPFEVLFGNIENVSVRLDGSAYTVAASNPGSRTARLTIMTP